MDTLNLKHWGLDVDAANADAPKVGDSWEHDGPYELTEEWARWFRLDPEPIKISNWDWTQKIAASLSEGRIVCRQFLVGYNKPIPTGNVVVQQFDLVAGKRQFWVEKEQP